MPRLFRSSPVLFNARLKFYPDRETGEYVPSSLISFDRQIFNPQHWEQVSDVACESVSISGDDFVEVLPDSDATSEEGQTDRKNSLRRSFGRAKTSAYDYLMCNPDCNMFLTLTFDKEQVDRYSYDDILLRLNRWLDNRVRRHGLKYVLIPEYHKDKAIHFHGIANASALRLRESGLVRYNKKNVPKDLHPDAPTIYNVDDFPYGFTTAIEATGKDSTVKVAKYIFKYMVKSGGEKVGGRYYLHGGALRRPYYEYYNVDFDKLPAVPFDVAPSVSFKRIDGENLLTFSRMLKSEPSEAAEGGSGDGIRPENVEKK